MRGGHVSSAMVRPSLQAFRRLTASTMSLLLAPLALRDRSATGSDADGPSCKLYARSWARTPTRPPLNGGHRLRVVQFNVLADGLSALDPELGGFTSAPRESLVWEYRRHRLLDEIFSHWGADGKDDGEHFPEVVALQEVDHYDWFAGEMGARGYDGVFLPKPNSPSRRSLDPTLEDGCALFWKRDGISMDGLQRISYKRLSPDGRPTEEPSNQVAILARMRLCDGGDGRCGGGAPFVLGVSHLLAQKDAAGERGRAHQMRQLLSAAGEEATACGAAATILCLDANAAPRNVLDYPPQAYPVIAQAGLRSAYASLLGGEPVYTTWKRRGSIETKHTIDYILVSPEVRRRHITQRGAACLAHCPHSVDAG